MCQINKNDLQMHFGSFDDDRGTLIPFEFRDLPFLPKRAFIVKNVPVNITRGNHSHYKTKQLILCLKGRVDVCIHWGTHEQRHTIEPYQSVYVPELTWDSQTFLTADAEILVFCSTNYDATDYIFDFKDFLKLKH